MKISPLRSYRHPKYPSRELFVREPHLFRDHTPSSWKEKTLVAGALAAFIFCGCTADKQSDSALERDQRQAHKTAQAKKIEQNGDISQAGKPSQTVEEKTDKAEADSVAPLFIHGEGRGSTGCVAIAPPVFITEEEARLIISEEMQKENITFNRTDVRIDEITIFRNGKTGRAPLVLDGICDTRNIGYEYVTKGNYLALGGMSTNFSVQDYDFRSVAENLREKLSDYGKMNAVIFYDPCTSDRLEHKMELRTETNRTIREQKLKAKSREQIKAQVRDFLEWMKDRSKG